MKKTNHKNFDILIEQHASKHAVTYTVTENSRLICYEDLNSLDFIKTWFFMGNNRNKIIQYLFKKALIQAKEAIDIELNKYGLEQWSNELTPKKNDQQMKGCQCKYCLQKKKS